VRNLKNLILASSAIVLSLLSVDAVFAFSGSGSGTSASPYMITTCTQLQEMNNAKSSYYKLANNIDCSATTTWNSGYGFLPVGIGSSAFTGTFDGDGKTISGLYINRTSSSSGAANYGQYVGLFGYTSGATVKNVGLVSVNISGYYLVAGIVGQTYGTSISNSYVTGSVSGVNNYVGGLVGESCYSSSVTTSYSNANISGASYVGGLVGDNYASSTISNSYARGTVTGTAGIGGLVGQSAFSITNSYATGNVTGTSSNVGGLVGYNLSSTITNSYATGNVSGEQAGGLVGLNYQSATVQNCYAKGNVSGTGFLGGLVGSNYYSSVILNSYSTGSVSSSTGSYSGRLLGYNPGSTVTNSYYWSGSTCTNCGAVYGTAEATLSNFYLATHNVYDTTSPLWDFSTVWQVQTAHFPALRNLPNPYVCGAGLYLSGASCVTTSPGYYSPAGDDLQYPSGVGYYAAAGSSSATACGGNNFYCPNSANVTPTTVTVGYYSTGGTATTRTGQSACGGNTYYCVSGVRTSVSTGYYSTGGTETTRTGQSQCTAGYYCVSGVQNQSGAGYYASGSGATSATACGVGYYCPNATNATPTPCGDNNHYCPTTTNISPTTVSFGHYSTGGTETTRTAQTICEEGFYCVSGVRTAAASGSYTSGTGNTSQTTCEAGYQCPGSANRTICGTGYSSASGASSCSAWNQNTPTNFGATNASYDFDTTLDFQSVPNEALAGTSSCSAQIDINDTDGLSLAWEGDIGTDGDYIYTSANFGDTYYYRYHCTDTAGNLSNWSNWSTGITVDDGVDDYSAEPATVELNNSTGTAALSEAKSTAVFRDEQVIDLSSSTVAEAPSTVVNGSTIGLLLDNPSDVKKVKLANGAGSSDSQITIRNTTSTAVITLENNTTFYAADTWNGNLTAPTDVTNEVGSDGSITRSAITFGSADSRLILDKAAKISLPTIAGTPYYSQNNGTTWTEISVCSDATENSAGSLVFPNECFIKTGSETVVWTYHFTTFGNLSETAIDISNMTIGAAPGIVTAYFEAQQEVPVGGEIVITIDPAYLMDDIADLTSHLTLYTDDGLNISSQIAYSSLINHTVTIGNQLNPIAAGSSVVIRFQADVFDLNPTMSGDYTFNFYTKDTPASARQASGSVTAHYSLDVEVMATVNEALVLGIDNNSLTFNVDPTVNGGQDDAKNNTLTVSSNCYDGYQIHVALEDDNATPNQLSGTAASGNAVFTSAPDLNSDNYFQFLVNQAASSLTGTPATIANTATSYSGSTPVLQSSGLGTSLTNQDTVRVNYDFNVNFDTLPDVYGGTMVYTLSAGV